MPLAPELYYPCLCEEEKGAIQVVFDNWIPTFFVVGVQPVTDWYNSLSTNFVGRQELWEKMFDVTREEIEIDPMLPPVEVYNGFYPYYFTWLFYPPIADDFDDTHCRPYEYSQWPM